MSNSFVTRHRWFPPEIGNFLDRQPHLGHITRPAAVAAGVGVLGGDSELVANDVGDLGHRSGRLCAKVVDVEVVIRILDDVLHGRNTL